MRIAIVNDMPLAREAMRRVVTSVPEDTVAWLAADGAEAILRARQERPDLILMDLIMPGTDGVEATRRIMAESPCPIVIVTSSVQGNLGKVYDAMSHGALDAIDTPTLGPRGDLLGATDLLAKVTTVRKLIGLSPARPGPMIPPVAPPPPPTKPPSLGPLVAIGASTGGPNALATIVSAFPSPWDAVVIIIQHVDVAFAPGLARWLHERTGRRVEVATPGACPEPGQILLAGTNDHLGLDAGRRLRHLAEPAAMSFRPSADVFFDSLGTHWRDPGVAALLTGMGRDGAIGLLGLRRLGWHTIAQDEATSVVWGMPRAAAEIGAAVEVLPIEAIGPAIVRKVRDRARHT